MPNDNPKLPTEWVDPILRENLTERLFFNTAKPNEVDFQTLFKAFIHKKEDGLFLDDNNNLIVGHSLVNDPSNNPTTNPFVRLEVNGAVKIGNADDDAPPGTIRYTTEAGFQGKHGDTWINLAGSGSSSTPPTTFVREVNINRTISSYSAGRERSFTTELLVPTGAQFISRIIILTEPTEAMAHIIITGNEVEILSEIGSYRLLPSGMERGFIFAPDSDIVVEAFDSITVEIKVHPRPDNRFPTISLRKLTILFS